MAGLPTGFGGTTIDGITGRGVSTTYLALVTADPGDSPTLASLAEDTTAGYARIPVTWSVPAGDPVVSSNTALLTFGPYTVGQTTPITHICLVTAASGTSGTVRYIWQLDESVIATITQTLQIAPGALTLGT